MSKNIKFIYLYRDSSNYKDWGEVVFSNDKEIDINNTSKEIISYLNSGEFFIAEKISVPILDLYADDFNFGYHEFSKIEYTDESPTDAQNHGFSEFVEELKSRGFLEYKLTKAGESQKL